MDKITFLTLVGYTMTVVGAILTITTMSYLFIWFLLFLAGLCVLCYTKSVNEEN